ncbi:MAG: ABC transporter permease subunit [Mesorhizobium sp.]|uniref:ABC transporter permease subunit n=1 Tax=Mesorhizobium sp. TaxID=1871066 RepID=UPI000FE5017B|nr:ABC transporter permease subunit [Mesorhizobium sp.]RWJ39837.1 MAG: ABC transporter permease subunit [Mesorhizobium sp.]RWJ81436.1 MAG: ABC transporter permease subunit [Mesorhizobium sp.]TIR08822.1 MAG: ABC transporter permease subunit [Mesorhizobium sp.]
MASTDTSKCAGRQPASGWLEGLLKGLGSRRSLVIAVPALWLVLFFLAPFLIVLWVSTSFVVIAQPPYTHIGGDGTFTLNIVATFGRLFRDALYINSYLNSLQVAAISTILCLIIAYPTAYGMARCGRSTRNILLMLVILPFWTSFLIRVYAWIGLLKNNGLINEILLSLDIIDSPLKMMNTNFAVYLGIVYSYLPFMILPLYANLEKMDLSLLEAATDLGCKPVKAFFAITVPLSFPGIVAGSMLVFIPAVGEYVIPELLGGSSSLMIGRVLVNEFFSNRDWPTASAVAVAILILLVVPLMIFQKYQDKELVKET